MTSARNDTSATTLLALDTATELCSVALLKKGQVFIREQLDPQGHSRLVLQMIEEVLEEGKTKRSDLEAVSYDAGPGSFTGIRIGAGVAQGISIGLKIPVLGISSLMILAESVGDENPDQRPVLAAIDARMKQIYWACLEQNAAEALGWAWRQEPTVGDPALAQHAASGCIGIGSGWDRYADAIAKDSDVPWIKARFPAAYHQACLAKRLFDSGGVSHWQHSLPTYVRDQVTG